MARTLGTYPLSSNIEIEAGAPLDARMIVSTKADLTASGSFPYPYIGMETYVLSEGKKYRLIADDPELAASWEEIKEGGGAAVISSGDKAGQIKVTPEEGTAYNVDVKNLVRSGSYGSSANIGIAYRPLIAKYIEGSSPKYCRIKIPNISGIDCFANLEVSVLQAWYTGGHGCKLLINFHNSQYYQDHYRDWDFFSAFAYGAYYSTTNVPLKVYGGDHQYIYISGVYQKSVVSVDKFLVSGDATSYDLSDIEIDVVDSLPEDYVTASLTLKPSYSFSEIRNKPTTISGYGITDAKIENGTITLGSNTITPLTSFTETDPTVPSWAKASTKPSYTFSEIGSKPTTISGYGITDAKIANGTITLGSNTITPLTSFTETDPTVPSWAKAANKPSYTFSEIGSKPTTISGYGITDAKIANGTITLGSNTITPLTSFTETDPTVPSWAKASSKPSYAFNEIGAGVATIGDGANRLMFRTNATYASGMYYSTPGNESMVFANKNSITSWIFATVDPTAGTSWQNLTPSLQIKNGKVAINKLIPNATELIYNLEVNGDVFTKDGIYSNGDMSISKKDSIEWTNNGDGGEPAFVMKAADNKDFKFKFTAYGTNIDVGWDWANVEGSGAFFRSASSSTNAGYCGLYARTTSSDTTQLTIKPGGQITVSGSILPTKNEYYDLGAHLGYYFNAVHTNGIKFKKDSGVFDILQLNPSAKSGQTSVNTVYMPGASGTLATREWITGNDTLGELYNRFKMFDSYDKGSGDYNTVILDITYSNYATFLGFMFTRYAVFAVCFWWGNGQTTGQGNAVKIGGQNETVTITVSNSRITIKSGVGWNNFKFLLTQNSSGKPAITLTSVSKT